MKEKNSYIGGLIHGVTSLLTGMKTTMTVFCRRKTTEQYPENRSTLKLSDRFRGTLTMPHNAREAMDTPEVRALSRPSWEAENPTSCR